jgi:transcriptional regulator with XRE-family HTH domain
MSIGYKIRKLRNEKHYTQKKLAIMIGVSREMIIRYEHDEATPSSKNLQELAKAFEISTDYLLSDDGNNETSNFGDKTLKKYFEEIDKMNDKERAHVKFMLNAVVNDKNRKKSAKKRRGGKKD